MEQATPKELSQRLRLAMAAKGVRNRAVATAAGVHVKTVSQWLGGRQKPESAQMVKLAEFLRVSEAWLWDGKEGKAAADDAKVENGYKVSIFSIRSGEMIADMVVGQSAAASVPDLIRTVIESDRKEKRRPRMRIEP